MSQPELPRRRHWSRIHWVVLCAALVAISSLLVFVSKDVSAKRTNKLNTLSNEQIELPIQIPGVISDEVSPDRIHSNTTDKAAASQIASPAIQQPASAEKLNPFNTTAAISVLDHNWLIIKIKSGDSVASIFKRQHLSPGILHQIMQLGKRTATLKTLQPGQKLKFLIDENQQLHELVYLQNRFTALHVRMQDKQFVATTLTRDTEKRNRHSEGYIDTSLFEDGIKAGISEALIMQMVNIFGWDIDFALDLRRGDHFSLLYKEHFLDGIKVGDGPILAAQFTNQGRVYRAVRFTDKHGISNYYSPEGLSMRKAFLRTPVDFRRISSRFGKRKHPVLNRMRLHKGVDYTAPRGTPVKASGDGKIIFRGRKGGYGKTIIIQHGGRYSTLYAHLSGYRRGLYNGKRVQQGQIIGYVGSTGRATGAHLHYEFRINGVHRNPLTVKLPNAAPIKKVYRDQFNATAKKILAQLESYQTTSLAANNH